MTFSCSSDFETTRLAGALQDYTETFLIVLSGDTGVLSLEIAGGDTILAEDIPQNERENWTPPQLDDDELQVEHIMDVSFRPTEMISSDTSTATNIGALGTGRCKWTTAVWEPYKSSRNSPKFLGCRRTVGATIPWFGKCSSCGSWGYPA
jgi:hypothetical protein